ncbi:MAG TPA: squalene--hopene cyclase [Candidatus Polarisedimenticolaceae bacterium]|nr:squalene--hopene cyclase [Candidatus Polarisedimenticolaceae bacterium]
MAREELIEFARYVERLLPARLGALVSPSRRSRGSVARETAAVALSVAEAVPDSLPAVPTSDSPVAESIRRAQERLRELQAADGHWCAELEGDTILESEYVLLLHTLERGSSREAAKACEHLRRKQLPTGGWTNYDGGPVDVGCSVKAYFALKLAGDDADGEPMARARRAILENGGIEACNSFTKILLAIFGEYDWKRCPAVIPEMSLLPHWFPFNIGDMSAWSRTILVPLSIVWAKKPRAACPDGRGIPELYVPGLRLPSSLIAVNPKAKSFKAWLWGIFFVLVSGFFNVVEAIGITPLRRRALATAERWILRRLEDSDGLGAIFPPIVNTILALKSLGYADEHPAVASQLEALGRLVIEDEETARLQPCLSPVWDTSIALHCLLASGVDPRDPRMLEAARWLLRKESTRLGDWAAKVPGVQPGGWFFEYRNAFYPDTDDTAQVLTSLAGVTFPQPREEGKRRAAIHRGLDWLLAMQNDDGGFGAFDRGCDKELLTYVPFADHNAMIDPSCEDITGRALETFAKLGLPPSHPATAAAARFLLAKQETDGSWYGRWGTNYLYGTWLAAWGLTRTSVDASHPAIGRAAAWVRSVQNEDGGWGESQRSYEDPATKGHGVSTASQTAWALMTLLAAGEASSRAVARGVAYLLDTQNGDGSWHDAAWTGTGFPRVFYLRYHLYATYFPLLALASYARERG